mmetsp:Transcript_29099/g.94905  ORF Transcript_29099/g.94905 Transcript_29099/m.94905 type:complete len:266 (-) Transcript_29099:791-1588(-)
MPSSLTSPFTCAGTSPSLDDGSMALRRSSSLKMCDAATRALAASGIMPAAWPTPMALAMMAISTRIISSNDISPSSTSCPPDQNASAYTRNMMSCENPNPSPPMCPRFTPSAMGPLSECAYSSCTLRSMANACTMRMPPTDSDTTRPASSSAALPWLENPASDFICSEPAMATRGVVASTIRLSCHPEMKATSRPVTMVNMFCTTRPSRSPEAFRTSAASVARRVVRAPGELPGSSNHSTSCRSMALNASVRSRVVIFSPMRLNA